MRKIVSEFLGIGEKSYYVWKNKSHIDLMKFIEKYLTETDIREFMETGEISKFEKTKGDKIIFDEYNQHILFNAILKINQIPDNLMIGKKDFWLKGFTKAIEMAKVASKEELIHSILSLDKKFYEHSNWKEMTAKWVMQNLSETEAKLMISHKDEVITNLNK